jgi:hypothetical protein
MGPKIPKGWRFTNDFRELNMHSESMKWTIPNIREMFDRIGQKRAKLFAKIDLTSGYHLIKHNWKKQVDTYWPSSLHLVRMNGVDVPWVLKGQGATSSK